MTSGQWYRVLMEDNITHQVVNSVMVKIPCRTELRSPEVEWERSWVLASTPGLPSKLMSFLWQMNHNILPCPTRLFRLKMPNIRSDLCTLCNLQVPGNLSHCLLACPYNDGAGQFLLDKLSIHISNLSPEQVVHLDLDVGQHQVPLVFLTALVLSEIWKCRKEKKSCHLRTIRASLEASINILRKSRLKPAAEFLVDLLDLN